MLMLKGYKYNTHNTSRVGCKIYNFTLAKPVNIFLINPHGYRFFIEDQAVLNCGRLKSNTFYVVIY